MKKDEHSHGQKSDLRRRAEDALQVKSAPLEGMAGEEVQRLIHELQVHQIELEMQNEELRRAQEELAALRDRYFDLFDFAPIGYFTLTEEGLILESNLAGANLLGVNRNELVNKPLSRFIFEGDQDIFYLHRERAIEANAQQACELRMVKKDASLFHAHLECARVEEPGEHSPQMRVILSDITGRVQVEQALLKSEAILSGAERLAHLGGWEWNSRNDVVLLSGEMQRIYGSRMNEVPMEEVLLILHPYDRAALRQALQNTIAGIEPLDIEYRIIRQNDQEERIIHASGEMIPAKTGIPYFLSGAAQDVTDLKANERMLKSYAARLESLNRDLQEFSSFASHDLQEPLLKIQRFSERLKARHRQHFDAEGQDDLDRIENAAKRMQSLIQDLLAYSRLSTQAPIFQEVDLNHLAHEVLLDLDSRIERTAGRVELGALPIITAEPTLMRQLLQNLIGNALKFHKPDVPPEVKVESSFPSDGLVEIRVMDHGIGFDEQYVERIFRPFERLHGQGNYEGSGIGLAICRRIVEKHSGQITAQSKPGEGAVFIVTLPLQQA